MNEKAKLESSPVITREKIKKEKYLGYFEMPDCGGELHLVKIKLTDGKSYLIAGGACNAGMLGEYVRENDSCFSLDENLQEFFHDIEEYENGGFPSEDLLAFYGSLVI